MKKLTIWMLIAAMALSLAACGGGGDSTPGSTGDGGAGSSSQSPAEAPDNNPDPDNNPNSNSDPYTDNNSDNNPDNNPNNNPTPNPDPILVSDPIEGEPLRYQVTGSSVYIQDLYDFMGAAMTVERPDLEDWQDEYVYYSFSGSDANVQDIEEYVNAICDGSYNLELTDKYVQAYDSVFVSYAIDYIGTGAVTSTMEANFSEISCTLSLYYVQERGKVKGALILPSSMEVVDMGLRQNGGSAELRLGGASAYAGLYLMPDGSFQTDDGRLHVQPGTALVLRDGNDYTAEAQFERGEREDHLWVKNFYRDETIFFSSPVSRLMTGDLFTMRDLYDDLSWAYASADEFDDFRHDTPFLGLGHDGMFISPRPSEKNYFQDITVRIMYWEPNEVGVYYIYAKLSSAPYEIEALVAAGLKKTEGYTGGDGEYELAVGQSMELTPSREYSTNYELFTWEIVDGAGVVELQNTVSATCTVKANRSGTAVIRVTYQYGVDEPDVLTGYLRNVDHTRTTEFTIYIT